MLSGRVTLIEDKTTDPLFVKVGSNYYFYHTDHLGTPQKMTAVNGAVVWAAKYSSFGKATVDAASTITNPLRFPGQYEDEETGLHYNYNRYYDPAIGRYISADPIGLDGGINLFAYVSNNPIVGKDPFGLEECDKDCPGGEWEGSSFFGLAAFYGGGGSIDRIYWSCKSSDVTCEAVYFCFGGGAIAEASIDVVGVASATKAYNSQNLTGWSTGWRGSLGSGVIGVSGTRTESIDNGTVIEHGSGGLSAGGGGAYIACTTLSTTCN